MKIGPNTRLGPYEVTAELGAGGMGRVYRARDTKLGREVAIKIVNPTFSADDDYARRFHREAAILASFTHPHVAAVYELDEVEGVSYLVMELVPGSTLAERLAQDRLTLAETLRIADQIASALEAAHDRNVIHRDLKPANVKITPSGVVKVLDFGLAKTLSESGLRGLSEATAIDTREGVIVGTVPYMSPEQARGQQVDHRTDIWAFGCLLFEMLANRRPFAGDTSVDTITSILERDPHWEALPGATPPGIRRLLRRCLQKDQTRRLRSIGDARIEIEEALQPDTQASPVVHVERDTRRTIVRAAAILLVGAVIGAVAATSLRVPPDASPRTAAHFVVPLGQDVTLAGLDFPATAISPDGTVIAYVATAGGRPQLFVRRVNSIDASALPGTTDAIGPFFSPDSRWIAFFAEGKLKKVPVSGALPIVVCDAPIGFGGTWGNNDVIVFAAGSGSGLSRVAASGGVPTRATTLDAQTGEFSHRWPELLPDGDTVVFTVGTVGSWDDAQIVAQSLSSGQRQLLIRGGTHPRYIAGHLLYVRGGTVFAVPFDSDSLRINGNPAPVLEDVLQSFDGAAQLTVSQAGDLVYIAGRFHSANRQLVTVDRTGAAVPFAALARPYSAPRVSPDGQKLLVTITSETESLWLYDISRGTLNQLTFEGNSSFPVWAPDGGRVAFSSNRAGALNLYWTPIDNAAAQERLAPSDAIQLPASWTADGRVLAFVERHSTTGRDIWMLPLIGDRKPYAFLNAVFDESAPGFSMDGRLIAYVSNESGQNEVYVRSFPGPSGPRKISESGGTEPVWAPNARTLFYRTGNRMMSVRFGPGAEPAGAPELLFSEDFEPGTLDRANYDVMPDGQRFVMLRATETEAARELRVSLRWLDEVTSQAPAR